MPWCTIIDDPVLSLKRVGCCAHRWYDGTTPLGTLGNYKDHAIVKTEAEYSALPDDEKVYTLRLQPDAESPPTYLFGVRERNWICYINSPNEDEAANVQCLADGE